LASGIVEFLRTQLETAHSRALFSDSLLALKSNYPIGSGVTEATGKTLVTQRMKCAGMRWNIKGGQGVLTARSLIQSEQFDKGWNVLSKTYIEKITLPENVIPFRKK